MLKAPATGQYGRGDPGGLVNILSKRPQEKAFSTLSFGTGSWDRYRNSLDVNTPLSEDGNLLSRVNMAIEDNGSFRVHVASERRIVSPSLSGKLSPDTRLLLDAEFSLTESVFDHGIPAGSDLLGIARHSGSLMSVYEFQNAALRGSDLGAAFDDVGERSGQAGRDFTLPSYSRAALLAHYRASEDVSLGPNLNTLFERKCRAHAYDSAWVLPGEPRNLSARPSTSDRKDAPCASQAKALLYSPSLPSPARPVPTAC